MYQVYDKTGHPIMGAQFPTREDAENFIWMNGAAGRWYYKQK